MPHINELYDFVVAAIIVHNNEVLLVNHPRYDKWLPIGGHIELHEDPEVALLREIKEESGLEQISILSSRPDFKSPGFKPLVTPNYVDVHEANAPHRHISFTYLVESKSPDFVLSAEHNAMRWFTNAELRSSKYNLMEAVIFYAEAALALAQKQLD